jgi:hypothetical protein
LLFIPDKNADDVPDGPAEVALDGFTVAEANYHNFANGLRWGPDGWLYGRCGHSCPGRLGVPGTPDELRVPVKGGLWRYHPDRKIVEVLTYGTTNPWGHDWDANGECFFINTVTGHLWHLITGSHLKDSNPSPNPGIYNRLDTVADHTTTMRPAAGEVEGANFGCLWQRTLAHRHDIYRGDAWPESYRGRSSLSTAWRRTNVDGWSGWVLGMWVVMPDLFRRLILLSWHRDQQGRMAMRSSRLERRRQCHEFTGVHRTSRRVFQISYGDPRPRSRCSNRLPDGLGRAADAVKQYQAGKQLRRCCGLLADGTNTFASKDSFAHGLLAFGHVVGPRANAVYPDHADRSRRLNAWLAKIHPAWCDSRWPRRCSDCPCQNAKH